MHPPVSPGRVLPRQPQHQLADLLAGTRATRTVRVRPMTEHDGLRVLGRLAAAQQDQPAEKPGLRAGLRCPGCRTDTSPCDYGVLGCRASAIFRASRSLQGLRLGFVDGPAGEVDRIGGVGLRPFGPAARRSSRRGRPAYPRAWPGSSRTAPARGHEGWPKPRPDRHAPWRHAPSSPRAAAERWPWPRCSRASSCSRDSVRAAAAWSAASFARCDSSAIDADSFSETVGMILRM